jgi:hypothetical protein
MELPLRHGQPGPVEQLLQARLLQQQTLAAGNLADPGAPTGEHPAAADEITMRIKQQRRPSMRALEECLRAHAAAGSLARSLANRLLSR